jgi:hypothetical protein
MVRSRLVVAKLDAEGAVEALALLWCGLIQQSRQPSQFLDDVDVAMVDDERRFRAYGQVWPAIWSVRNRIAHGYVFVDRAIITATVENDLGELEQGLRSIELDATPSDPPPASRSSPSSFVGQDDR